MGKEETAVRKTEDFTIGIVGAGTMGLGVATHFAVHGHRVHLFSRAEETLQKAKKQVEENIASIEVLDYDKMYDSLKKQLNEIADYQWMLIQFGQGNSYSSAMLAQNYSAVRDTFDAIKDGELQQDNADIVRQLRAAENQVVMAAESLYVALLEMDLTDASLGRSLDTLERSIQEMELRYDLGQISALTLQQVTAGRTSLVSGRQTLAMNRTNYTMQLELMVATEEMAKDLAERFRKDPEHLYARVLEALYEEQK